ncbi:HAMP domain-containing histidine kinase [Patescibacteria group bacterium]|nr:HAMP domain-containing histidine kinase [Patescibacteria group bacterium]
MAKIKTTFFLKQYQQVIYAIILIILIPLAIILNTIWSVKSFQRNIDISLQRQALLIGQVFDATVYQDIADTNELQAKVESLAQSNIGLTTFDVLAKEGENFKTIASLQAEKVGNSANDLNYIIAWHQDEAIATLVSGLAETGRADERFWELAMPLHSKTGDKEAILSLRLSLKLIDDLVKGTLTNSYIILAITIMIVILLLALNTRLFEHAILFKKLKEVDQMKDEFISIASHELRTPITTLKGFVSMALEGDYGNLNEQGTKGFKIMEASINRLGSLVEDLLNVSRIEQNRLIIKRLPLDTKAILNSLADEFEFRIKEKGLIFKKDLADDLPRIWADEDRFRQVVINLMGNAVKYTKQGEIELTAKASDKKFVTITVKDSGIGMTAQERQSLFEKFYRIQSDDTKGIVGTGLGLWITKQIVEILGGQIFVDSIKHVGSQFYFTIPIYNPLTHKQEENKK